MTTPFPRTVSGWMQIIVYTTVIIGAVFAGTAFLLHRSDPPSPQYNQDNNIILERLDSIIETQEDIKSRQDEIRNDLRDLQGDVSGLKSETSELKTNVDWLKRYLPIPQLGAR